MVKILFNSQFLGLVEAPVGVSTSTSKFCSSFNFKSDSQFSLSSFSFEFQFKPDSRSNLIQVKVLRVCRGSSRCILLLATFVSAGRASNFLAPNFFGPFANLFKDFLSTLFLLLCTSYSLTDFFFKSFNFLLIAPTFCSFSLTTFLCQSCFT